MNSANSGTRGRVLLVDDDPMLTKLWLSGLETHGFEAFAASNPREALELFPTTRPEVVLTDLQMGDTDGLELCEQLNEVAPSVPVLLVTGHGDLQTAVAAIRAEVYDFLIKPLALPALVHSLDRAIRHTRLTAEVQRLRTELLGSRPLQSMIGESHVMTSLEDLVRRASRTDTTILVTGETGSGKELVARELHARSPRAGKPFVTINCAALPEALLESELFGHKRGAFTDAREDRQGLFLEAAGGTLFLDEIGDMALPLQAKLLRALQERLIRPIGTNKEISVDVRVVAATHRDLESRVEDGSFRQDLLYRLNVIEIEVPPLRARGNDVLLLAQHFVEHYARLTGRPVVGIEARAANRLLAYDWPGNVRELQNCLERAVALTEHDQVVSGDFPPRIREWTPPAAENAELITLEMLERRHILSVLKAVDGNKARAATILDIGRKTLYRKLARFEGQTTSS